MTQKYLIQAIFSRKTYIAYKINSQAQAIREHHITEIEISNQQYFRK